MSPGQQRFVLPWFLSQLARPSRICLDSPIDDLFMWPEHFNFLSLITPEIVFNFVWNRRL